MYATHQEFTLTTSEQITLAGRIDAPETPKAIALILHGLCEHYGRYGYVTEALTRADYAVIRFDHRGHGRSMGRKAHYDNRTQIISDTGLFVEQAREFFPGLALFMVGHSMGGFGAASFGTAFPHEIAGYVLSGAAVRDNKGITATDPEAPDDLYLPNGLAGAISSDPAVVAAYQEDPLVGKEFSVGLMRALCSGILWLKENAQAFADPVLLLHGGADLLVDPQDSLDLFTDISSPDKSLRIYAGLFHEVFNEPTRDRVIRDTIEWLDDRAG